MDKGSDIKFKIDELYSFVEKSAEDQLSQIQSINRDSQHRIAGLSLAIVLNMLHSKLANVNEIHKFAQQIEKLPEPEKLRALFAAINAQRTKDNRFTTIIGPNVMTGATLGAMLPYTIIKRLAGVISDGGTPEGSCFAFLVFSPVILCAAIILPVFAAVGAALAAAASILQAFVIAPIKDFISKKEQEKFISRQPEEKSDAPDFKEVPGMGG